MNQQHPIDINQKLAYLLHEMLGFPESAELQVEDVPGPTTAITLRVSSAKDPGKRFFVKTLKKVPSPGRISI